MDKKKEFTPQEVAEELRKSLYKMVSKSIRKSNKDKASAQKIVEDILDPNYVAEVNPEEVPDEKDGVLWKKKNSIDKLKKFKKNKIEKSKGVHQPIEPKGGQSKAGEASRKLTDAKNRKVDNKDWWGRASKETQSNHGKAKALSEHHKVIRDSRKMGKPDLPKSEK
jgi:hypothetical protein